MSVLAKEAAKRLAEAAAAAFVASIAEHCAETLWIWVFGEEEDGDAV